MGIKNLNLTDYPDSDAFLESLQHHTRNTGTGVRVTIPDKGDVIVLNKHRQTAFQCIDLGIAVAKMNQKAGVKAAAERAIANGQPWGGHKALMMTEEYARNLVSMREQGLSWRAIAENLDCALVTARKRYDRAVKLLRK